ncbi:unnamed protein product [Thelazia callipaeda]|uniref:Protein shisa-5 n=1 Tax=Thelazia callipaeda TaxID=103827 RepID=A0A0N5D5I2_THECL|nr:unnamed protein product [Thelazia callipaeda]
MMKKGVVLLLLATVAPSLACFSSGCCCKGCAKPIKGQPQIKGYPAPPPPPRPYPLPPSYAALPQAPVYSAPQAPIYSAPQAPVYSPQQAPVYSPPQAPVYSGARPQADGYGAGPPVAVAIPIGTYSSGQSANVQSIGLAQPAGALSIGTGGAYSG